MANQYTGSFEHIVRSKCQCSARALLEKAEQDHLSYSDVGDILGLKQVTIRKWASRFGVRLSYKAEPKQTHSNQRAMFQAKDLNAINFLSRTWAASQEEMSRAG